MYDNTTSREKASWEETTPLACCGRKLREMTVAINRGSVDEIKDISSCSYTTIGTKLQEFSQWVDLRDRANMALVRCSTSLSCVARSRPVVGACLCNLDKCRTICQALTKAKHNRVVHLLEWNTRERNWKFASWERTSILWKGCSPNIQLAINCPNGINEI